MSDAEERLTPAGDASALTRVEFFIPGKPAPASRPRVEGGRVHYARRYEEWRQRAKVEILAQCGRLLWTGDLEVSIVFVGADRRADIDNLLKAVLDAAEGIIYENDKQVKVIGATLISAPRNAKDLGVYGTMQLIKEVLG